MITYFELEKEALCGNRPSIIKLVSAFRQYRQAIELLKDPIGIYRDGTAEVLRFFDNLEEIDEDHLVDGD